MRGKKEMVRENGSAGKKGLMSNGKEEIKKEKISKNVQGGKRKVRGKKDVRENGSVGKKGLTYNEIEKMRKKCGKENSGKWARRGKGEKAEGK